MDSLVNQTLESVCAYGSLGIPISNLFQSISPNPSNLIKKFIFERLLSSPFLKFVTGDDSTAVDAEYLEKFESLEELEVLKVRVVADEEFRSSFVGLDDLNAATSKVPDEHRRTLERIAATRTSGITQRDLAKEFGIKGNKFFYQVKYLESQQLIVRQSAVLWEREMGNIADRENKNVQVMHTQLLRLNRYSKYGKLNSQQRVEIIKPTSLYSSENMGEEDETQTECMKEDMQVKDFLPRMKAICDKLEEANQKVVVVSDIKAVLNYKGVKGQRAWRYIANRLEGAGLVETFHAKINGKDVPFLRLLKKFDPNDFQSKPITSKYDGCDNDGLMKNGKQGYITDQLLELPLEHCIYDMIDAEGPKGLTILEVSKRLGLNSRRTYDRIHSLCTRFGMRMESEKPGKSVLYRIWTHKNYNMRSNNVSSGDFQEHQNENSLEKSISLVKNVNDVDINSSKQTSLDEDWGIADESVAENDSAKQCTNPNAKENGIIASESPVPASPMKPQRSKFHLLFSTTELGIRREQLIIERLEETRFILHGELLKWLKDAEKGSRPTSLDRRTLNRALNNLQKHGKCKLSQVSIPSATNFNQNREHVVILHPTVESKDMMDQIYERYREFGFQSHSREASKSSANTEKSSNQADDISLPLHATRTYDCCQAKIMVSAKLLHQYLWSYINSLTGGNKRDLKTFEFVMKNAIDIIPLELYPQIVGATKEINDMASKYKPGSRLLDLSSAEKKSLLGTRATGRLSRIIDILIRLKLIHLACQESRGVNQDINATPKYIMDLEPYIEAPLSKSSSSKANTQDLRPRIRHDFVFLNDEDVAAYWQTLNYCYANADPASAKLAFPGTAVKELHRVYPDKQPKRSKRVRKTKKSSEASNEHASKRRRHSKDNSFKLTNDAETTEASCESDMDIDTSALNATEIVDDSVDVCIDTIHDDSAVEPDPHEVDERSYSLITKHVYSHPIPRRKRRFTWTDEFDRKLVTEYARECVRLGDKFFRVMWSSLENLPTDSLTCKKRINKLKNDKSTRKAVMKLCNLLKERYIEYSRNSQTTEDENFQDNNIEEEGSVEHWDDFENPELKMVLDEIIKCKRLAKLNYANRAVLKRTQGWEDAAAKKNSTDVQEPSTDKLSDSQNESEKRHDGTKPRKNNQVNWSTSIANAVELLKLIFLSYSASFSMQSSLAETLAHYPKSDIISAFNYLKDKEYVVIGNEKQRPVLSRKFWHNTSTSPFPIDSGKRASDFLTWLLEKSKNLEDEIDLHIDIYCGEIFQICALVSSDKLFISPSLPEEGVGEAEESRSSRARDDDESENLINEEDNRNKANCKLESDYTYRREKGFPGIKVISQHASVPKVDTLECSSLSNEMKRLSNTNMDASFSALAFNNQSILDNGELPYAEMANYANLFTNVSKEESFTFCPEMFRGVCSVIDQADEQGLNIEEISQLICTKDLQLAEIMVDTLELFKAAFKVMAFDSIRLVNSTYRPKYFIGIPVGHNMDSSIKSQIRDKGMRYKNAHQAMENGTSISEGHKITTLVPSPNPSQHQLESQTNRGSITEGHKLTLHAQSPNPSQDQSEFQMNKETATSDKALRYKDEHQAVENGRSISEGHKITSPVPSPNLSQHQLESHSNKESITEGHIITLFAQSPNPSLHQSESQTNRATAASNTVDVFLEKSNDSVNKSSYCRILPWINCDGSINSIVCKGLGRRVLGIVMQNPGMLEEDIVRRMDVLNPQSCLKLLEAMVLDNHLYIKKMYQTASSANPPSILQSLFSLDITKPKSVTPKHYFANPNSASLL